MLALHLALDTVEAATRVRVWDDERAGLRHGCTGRAVVQRLPGRAAAALVRFDPEHKRLSERRWTGEVEAENAFADGFPLLVMGAPRWPG
jgi:uncharacterized protein